MFNLINFNFSTLVYFLPLFLILAALIVFPIVFGVYHHNKKKQKKI